MSLHNISFLEASSFLPENMRVSTHPSSNSHYNNCIVGTSSFIFNPFSFPELTNSKVDEIVPHNVYNKKNGRNCIYLKNIKFPQVNFTLPSSPKIQNLVIHINNFSIGSIYILTNISIYFSIFHTIFGNMHIIFFLVGDFKCHHTFWNSDKIIKSDKILHDYITNNNADLLIDSNPPLFTKFGKSIINLAFWSSDIFRYPNEKNSGWFCW